LRTCGAVEISVFASDEEVAAGKPTRRCDPPIVAALSFLLTDLEKRGPGEAAIRSRVPALAGYLVGESRPITHERCEGRRLPGMVQMTCLTKRPEIDSDEFRRLWHEDHLSVAIETQSTFGYVRNEIIRPLTEGAPQHWAGIVEETFPIEALTDPRVFFNAQSDAELSANVGRMVESCQRFLDLGNLEVTFMSEYYFD
jgi:hypothetical protein